MKPILLLQLRPENEASDNEYEAIIKSGKLKPEETERFRLESKSLPDDLDLSEYSGVIVGGGPFNAGEPEKTRSEEQKRVEGELEKLLKEIIDKDFPFLGICYGIGILNRLLGGPVASKQFGEPVTGIDVCLTEEGKKDKLLAGFPDTFRALVGHKEGNPTTNDQTVLLAKSDTCIQMIRIGQNVYATQFHPEADAVGFEIRINVYKHHGYFPPEEASELIEKIKREEIVYPTKILERFVDLCRQNS